MYGILKSGVRPSQHQLSVNLPLQQLAVRHENLTRQIENEISEIESATTTTANERKYTNIYSQNSEKKYTITEDTDDDSSLQVKGHVQEQVKLLEQRL